jgi:phage tail-like protein
MPNPAFETTDPPFVAFRFEVVLTAPGMPGPLCSAAFAECDGLEMSMEPKAVAEGGNNIRQQHRVGPVRYGQLTLKRGMTNNFDLWRWFVSATQPGRSGSADCTVTLWAADGTPQVSFVLGECLPIKLRGPSLNAQNGQIAVEELQLVYAVMEVRPAGGDTIGLSFGGAAGITAGASFGASAGFSAGASVSGGVSASGGISASASAGASLDIG